MGGRGAKAAGGVIRLCFHGAESTGKSVLAARLAAELDLPWVGEYGREWAEANGTDFTMENLLAMAAGQDAAMRRAAAHCPPLLLLDTDPLMTAAWARRLVRFLIGRSASCADHLLLCCPCLPSPSSLLVETVRKQRRRTLLPPPMEVATTTTVSRVPLSRGLDGSR